MHALDPIRRHWTLRLLERFPLFEEWYNPSGFNFHVLVKPKAGAGRASMFLWVPPADFRRFLGLVSSVPGYDSPYPNHWFSVLEYPQGKLKFFLDVEIRGETGLSAREIKDSLTKFLPPCEIYFLSKGENAGENTHWHIVTSLVDRWRRHVERAKQLVRQLKEGTLQDELLAHGIDEVVYNRPPTLRSPRSVKLFNEVDDRFYRVVATYTPNSFTTVIHPDMQDHADSFAFLGVDEAAPEVVRQRAWTSNNRLLTVPDFDALMPFEYSDAELDVGYVNTLVDEFFAARGLDQAERLEPDHWNELQSEVVAYLNQFFAHSRDVGVFVVCPPHTYSPNWDPNWTVVLHRNIFRPYSIEAFHKAFSDLQRWLWLPSRAKPCAVKWTERWIDSPDKKVYSTSFGFSKPLMQPAGGRVPRVFNTWTGPGVSADEAFEAVRKDPERARVVVDFFIEYLETVVCGDPFEDETYNRFAFQAVLHLLIWLVKRPHDPFPCIVYFWSPEQGVGKGQLTNLMTVLIGMHNTHSGVGVNGLSGSFAGYIADKLLWVMDEESSRAKELEANGMIKHLATDPLLTGDKKYQAPRTFNNSLKIVASSNQLRPVHLTDRRWLSLAMNAVRRGDTQYWSKFVDLVFLNDGYLYLAAWLYGMEPHPSFKVGMQIPKGYLRVRQAEKETNTDPLQAVLMPWFATASLARTEHRKYNTAGPFVDVMEVTEEVFSIDDFSASFPVPTKKFLDDWYSGKAPSGHYNQPLLAGLAIDRKRIIEEALQTKILRSYTVHNLKRSIGEVFGDKNAPIFSASEGHTFSHVVMATEDTFAESVRQKFCQLIDQSRTFRIGNEEVPGVWPIPVERLDAFVQCGVTREPDNGTVAYKVSHILDDYGNRQTATVLLWPSPESTREKCFQNAGGGRTPVSEIDSYPTNYKWHRIGFGDIAGHATTEAAQEFLGDQRAASLAQQEAMAERIRQRERDQREFELMMAGE